jgi:hypothetical protein
MVYVVIICFEFFFGFLGSADCKLLRSPESASVLLRLSTFLRPGSLGRFRRRGFRVAGPRASIQNAGSFGCRSFLAFRNPSRGFPFALFLLLRWPGLADTILETPVCLLDDFSFDFIAMFRDIGLTCPAAIAILRVIAELARVDTVNVEVAHSFWQREDSGIGR